MEPVSQLLIGLWGPIKTGKTTFSLTAPKPVVHLDLDQGFERAEPNFLQFRIRKVPSDRVFQPVDFQGADIITKPYQPPIRWGKKAVGFLAFWETLLEDIRLAYEAPEVASIVLDTATAVWKARISAHLERAQQRNPDRLNLLQIEYGEPNSDMRAIHGAARTYHKNLVLVHHVGGVYEEHLNPNAKRQEDMKVSVRVGDTWDGFGGMGQFADIIVKAEKVVGNPAAEVQLKILTCGLSLAAEGLVLPSPTFSSLLAVVNTLRSSSAVRLG